jgi:hypothetical protein
MVKVEKLPAVRSGKKGAHYARGFISGKCGFGARISRWILGMGLW